MRLMPILIAAAAFSAPALAQQMPNDNSVGRAATQPLRDTKIQKDKIPEVLLLAQSAPYSSANTRSCGQIATEVQKLNAVLGDDADVEGKKKGEGSYVASAATRAAVNTLIPGLGLVRVITGADKAQRRVEAAVHAGAVRRAYLKGIGLTKGCRPVAAPYPAAVADQPELPPVDDKDEKKDDKKDEN
ncbi:MAG: hypothetical protein A4S12_03710 [Proteobacteria bacterium SG_bin5]|nr:hypothetical protein [Sphingomonas sp.]OQW43966.1 MAG: hypothetical protein A4S12_03710 [Proteobacteria bacterium SG_bin5]